MTLKLVFFVTLALLYFAHDTGLSWWFKKRFGKEDDFIGQKAPDAVQRYFGKAIYFTLAYYLLILVYLATGFDFWGLISNITLLGAQELLRVGFILGCLFLLLMTLARLNLASSWRVGLDHATTDPLITGGFYRFVRNPYFAFLLGFEFVLILIVPNAVTLFAFIQSAILLGLQVRHEEGFLQEKYGKAYARYKAKTGRFFPQDAATLIKARNTIHIDPPHSLPGVR